MATPDGAGRFVHFEKGSIYWAPEGGTHEILGDITNVWGRSGFETGSLGYPIANHRDISGGVAQDLQSGAIAEIDGEKPRIVCDEIGRVYKELGGAEFDLGLPVDDDKVEFAHSVSQRFEHGATYWTPETGAQPACSNDIADHWDSTGYENDPLGCPVGPSQPTRARGLEQQFEGDWVRQLNGKIVEERNKPKTPAPAAENGGDK